MRLKSLSVGTMLMVSNRRRFPVYLRRRLPIHGVLPGFLPSALHNLPQNYSPERLSILTFSIVAPKCTSDEDIAIGRTEIAGEVAGIVTETADVPCIRECKEHNVEKA